MQQHTRKPEVPFYERLVFGMADFFGGGAQALITAIYTVFLTMNGVPIALAGVIVAVAKAWDAVNDPLIGVLSDNTRTRFGRHRPYILVGGALGCIELRASVFTSVSHRKRMAEIRSLSVFLSRVQHGGQHCAGFLTIRCPTEISTSYRETTRINTLRLYFSMASGGVSALVPVFLIDRLHAGTLSVNTFSMLIIFVFGSVYCVPLILCGILCKERASVSDQKSVFSYRSFLAPFRVRAFCYLLIIYLYGFTCLDIISVNIVYFAKYSLRLPVPSFVMLFSIMAAYIGMMPVLSLLMKKERSKPSLIRLGIPLYIISAVTLALVPQGTPAAVVIILCLLIGAGMSGCQMMPWILFPDVVDVAELKLGSRASGSFSGIMTLCPQSDKRACHRRDGVFAAGGWLSGPSCRYTGRDSRYRTNINRAMGLTPDHPDSHQRADFHRVYLFRQAPPVAGGQAGRSKICCKNAGIEQNFTEAENEILAKIQADLF